jgi:hypothetical protein
MKTYTVAGLKCCLSKAVVEVKVKVKQPVTGPVWPKGFRRFRLLDFMTFGT